MHGSLTLEVSDTLKKYQRPRDHTRYATLDEHVPRILALTKNLQSVPACKPNIVVLGDEVLGNLASELESLLDRDTHTEASDRVTASKANLLSEVLDLTVEGDSIANVLYRLDAGLFDSLSTLFKATRSSASTVVILQIGSQDTLTEVNKHKRTTFQTSSLAAYRTLLRVLLQIDESVKVIVVGRVFRADVRMDLVQGATSELFAAADTVAAEYSGRLQCLEAPLALKVTHLDTDLKLNRDGCRLIATAMQPRIASMLRLSPDIDDSVHALEQSDVDVGEVKCALRPAHDVLSRILHDTDTYDPDQIVVGYLDRHEGVQEMSASHWRRDSTDEEFIPMHRIRYFKTAKEPQRTLWHRAKRIDNVFRTSDKT